MGRLCAKARPRPQDGPRCTPPAPRPQGPMTSRGTAASCPAPLPPGGGRGGAGQVAAGALPARGRRCGRLPAVPRLCAGGATGLLCGAALPGLVARRGAARLWQLPRLGRLDAR
eukprot:1425758-Lingulodinium_polyedra.AAC.1